MDKKGMLLEAQRMRDDGMTCKQAAEVLGVSKSWVHKWTKRSGNPWNRWGEDEVMKLKALAEKGLSYKQIANAMGRSVGSIRLKLHRIPHNRLYKSDRDYMLVQAILLAQKAVDMGCKPSRAFTAVRRADVMGRCELKVQ